MKNAYYIDKSKQNKTLTVLSKICYMKHDIQQVDRMIDDIIKFNQQIINRFQDKE